MRKFLQFTITGLVVGLLMGFPISLVSGDVRLALAIGGRGTLIGVVLGVAHRNDP
jgi:hypothetical protein